MKSLLTIKGSRTLLLTVLFLITMIGHSSAQQLLDAYQHLYKADSLVQAGNYQAAVELDVNGEKILKNSGMLDRDIAGLYIRLKNIKKANDYIKKAVINGVDIDRLNGNPVIRSYLKSINYNDNTADYLADRKIYNCNIGNPDQRIEIIQMHERDQAVRDLIPVLDPKLLNKLVFQVDSANYDQLKEILKNGRFPGYSEVGLDGETDLLDLMMHIPIGQIPDKGDFDVLDSMMFKQVQNGNLIPPFYYALIIDRYSATILHQQVYGTYWEYNRVKKVRVVTKIRDVKNVDKLRRSIFLPPLESSRKPGYILPEDYQFKQ
jgi:tetratricopeptide (TPR) repeat protein